MLHIGPLSARSNPYYFFLILIGLLGLNSYHIFDFRHDLSFSPFFFLAYAIGQTFLEVLLLTFVANLIKKYLHKSIYYFFIIICFLSLFVHYADFIFIRIMNFSLFYGIDLVLDETFENLVEMLYLTGINLTTWLFIALLIIIIVPLFALLLHYLTSKLLAFKPWRISHRQILKGFIYIPLGLVMLDFTFSPFIDREDFQFYRRILPWKKTFFTPKEEIMKFKGVFSPKISEKKALKKLHSCPMALEKKPNIYLFIAESLREDFVTEESAPFLTNFRNENIKFGQTLSNANCTQLAWSTIFHSHYSFHWERKRKKCKAGSIPLQALKKLGYKIHVYSGAQLKYFGLKESIFGKKHRLANTYHFYPHYPPVKTFESDQKVIKHFRRDLKKKWAKEGNVFIIFLDSTHFNYSWPPDFSVPFTPFSEEKTAFRISNSLSDIEKIKNRYRNSIFFMDTLFGDFIHSLKEQKLYQESLIVFTGDHGEEFFEEGQLFHASHLSRMQTSPPIYYKFGNNHCFKNIDGSSILTSHVDIFPTILDYLVGEKPFFELLDGESIFKENRFPYVIAGNYNGGRCPIEFFIYDGKKKLIARFISQRKIFGSNQIKIVSIKDAQDQTLHIGNSKQTKAYLMEHYDEAFRRLFH